MEKNGGVEGRGRGEEEMMETLKPKQQARLSREVKDKSGTIYTVESIRYNQHFKICK